MRLMRAYRGRKSSGLYLVPSHVTRAQFREEFARFDNKKVFEEENFLGIVKAKPQKNKLWYPGKKKIALN